MQRFGEMLVQGISPDSEICVLGTVRAHFQVGAHQLSVRNGDVSIRRGNNKEKFLILVSVSDDPEAIFNLQRHMPTLSMELIAKMPVTEKENCYSQFLKKRLVQEEKPSVSSFQVFQFRPHGSPDSIFLPAWTWMAPHCAANPEPSWSGHTLSHLSLLVPDTKGTSYESQVPVLWNVSTMPNLNQNQTVYQVKMQKKMKHVLPARRGVQEAIT